MSQEKAFGNKESDDEPGSEYLIFAKMESLNEKLKMLDYENHFYKSQHQKPISRHYFASPTNPGEQFYCFTSLSAWLIHQANGKIDQPQEYDDPNATISNILEAVRGLGYKIEFSPSKLKCGYGEFCIAVLNMLADSCLQIKNIRYQAPKYIEEVDNINIEDDNSSQSDEDTIEWTGPNVGNCFKSSTLDFNNDGGFDDAEDEEEVMANLTGVYMKDLNVGTNSTSYESKNLERGSSLSDSHKLGKVGDNAKQNSHCGMLESTTDATDWQLEVERVLPQLRVTVRNDIKDWRNHLDQLKHLAQDIDSNYTEIKPHLERLSNDLNRALDKINSREKYINNQLEPLMNEHRLMQDDLSEVTSKYRQASGGITTRSVKLADISEELERVKVEMDERGTSMTDGSPVVRIKQAIQRLKSEIIAMNIRTGVLEHILLRIHLRVREDSQKPLFSKDNELNTGSTFVY